MELIRILVLMNQWRYTQLEARKHHTSHMSIATTQLSLTILGVVSSGGERIGADIPQGEEGPVIDEQGKR